MSFEIVCGNKQNVELNALLSDYVALHIWGHGNDFGPSGSMGVLNKGKLIAAVVFHNWHEDYGIIELSAAATDPRWLGKKTIRTIMDICFVQHRCQQIVSRIAVDNERTLKIYRFLGFTEILLPNMRGSGKHEFVMMLTADQWRVHKLNEERHG